MDVEVVNHPQVPAILHPIEVEELHQDGQVELEEFLIEELHPIGEVELLQEVPQEVPFLLSSIDHLQLQLIVNQIMLTENLWINATVIELEVREASRSRNRRLRRRKVKMRI